MRVLFVTAEAYPLAKTGGLADVSHALPVAMARQGIDARLMLPAYPSALLRIENPRVAVRLEPILGVENAKLVSGRLPDSDLPVLLLDAPGLFDRPGGLYRNFDGNDWPDNAFRFAYLSHVAAHVAMGRTRLDWTPELVHANDWHTGLVPLLLSAETKRPSTLFTAHNMAFQGNFEPDILPAIGVGAEYMSPDGMEFYGQASFLKAGLRYSDRVTTVSPTYAKEIVTAQGGCGLDGVLRLRGAAFSGILNGIDDAAWNPATDALLPQTFRPSDLSGKKACKASVQRECGLAVDPDIPLVGYISRLTHQKMADTILYLLPQLAERKLQFVLVGEGDRWLEDELRRAQALFSDRIVARIEYDEAMAHRLQAGCDILLAPARFEPCGLTQLYALRYGTVPVVRRTGGLADTVVDATLATMSDRSATGFVFEDANAEGLLSALDRALAFYGEPLAWRRLQVQAMAQNFSWDCSASRYIALYREVTAEPCALPDSPQIESDCARQIAI